MRCLSQLDVVVVLSIVAVVGLVAPPCGAQVIDDFESYADNGELNLVWSGSSAVISLDTSTASNGGGTQSMRYVRQDVAAGSGSGTGRSFASPVDWSGETLSVWVRRDSSSVSPTEFSFFIMDSSSNPCLSFPFLSVTDTEWHLLSYDLAMCSGAFDASSIASVSVSIGNGSSSVADVVANIDDLSLDGSVPVELLAFEVQ